MIKTNPLFNELTADNIMKRGNLMDGRERERERGREREEMDGGQLPERKSVHLIKAKDWGRAMSP